MEARGAEHLIEAAAHEGWPGRFADIAAKALPAGLFGLRLATAVSFALFVAFYLELDNPSWAGTTGGHRLPSRSSDRPFKKACSG